MDALWNAIDVSEGFVALTHEESDSLGLPRSKTFPWDINKGMYVSHGHHALHCTVSTRHASLSMQLLTFIDGSRPYCMHTLTIATVVKHHWFRIITFFTVWIY